MTIRKFAKDILSLDQMVALGGMPEETWAKNTYCAGDRGETFQAMPSGTTAWGDDGLGAMKHWVK